MTDIRKIQATLLLEVSPKVTPKPVSRDVIVPIPKPVKPRVVKPKPEPFPRYECRRCGHKWHAMKRVTPKMCPGCHSSLWQFSKEERPTYEPVNDQPFPLANYDGIIEFYKEHGMVDTLEHYHCSQHALERMIQKGHVGLPEIEKVKMLCEMAMAGNSDLRGEIGQLKESYGQFVELVANQLVSKMVQAIKGIEIELPKALEMPDDEL